MKNGNNTARRIVVSTRGFACCVLAYVFSLGVAYAGDTEPDLQGGTYISGFTFDGTIVCFDFTDTYGQLVEDYCTTSWGTSAGQVHNYFEGYERDGPFWNNFYIHEEQEYVTQGMIRAALQDMNRWEAADQNAYCPTVGNTYTYTALYSYRDMREHAVLDGTRFTTFEKAQSVPLVDWCSPIAPTPTSKGTSFIFDGRRDENSPPNFTGTCEFKTMYQVDSYCPRIQWTVDQMRQMVLDDAQPIGNEDRRKELLGILTAGIDYDVNAPFNFFSQFLISYACTDQGLPSEECSHVPPVIDTGGGDTGGGDTGGGDTGGGDTGGGDTGGGDVPCNPLIQNCGTDMQNNAAEEILNTELPTETKDISPLFSQVESNVEACPAPLKIQSPMFDEHDDIEISFDVVCTGMDYMRPMLILLAIYASVNIVLGSFRGVT